MFRGIGCLLSGFRHLLGEVELRAILWRMLILLAGLMLLLSVGVYELSQYLVVMAILSASGSGCWPCQLCCSGLGGFGAMAGYPG